MYNITYGLICVVLMLSNELSYLFILNVFYLRQYLWLTWVDDSNTLLTFFVFFTYVVICMILVFVYHLFCFVFYYLCSWLHLHTYVIIWVVLTSVLYLCFAYSSLTCWFVEYLCVCITCFVICVYYLCSWLYLCTYVKIWIVLTLLLVLTYLCPIVDFTYVRICFVLVYTTSILYLWT